MAVSEITSVSRKASTRRSCWARTLGAIVRQADGDDVVLKSDLEFGDQVLVSTRNSVYSLWSLGGDHYVASGGWFDAQTPSPTTVTVNGCTYGGSAIRHDVVAGRGLFLEFGNSVCTTRIRDVRVFRFKDTTTPDRPVVSA